MFILSCTRTDDGAMDNLPTVIMEAMAAGLPVVSTDVAAVAEMIVDEKTGFIVPERTPGPWDRRSLASWKMSNWRARWELKAARGAAICSI